VTVAIPIVKCEIVTSLCDKDSRGTYELILKLFNQLASMNCFQLYRFGRKKALLAVLTLKTIGSAIAIFSASYASFMIGRFVGAVGTSGCFLTSFVIGRIY